MHPVPIFWRPFGFWVVFAVCVSLQIAGTAKSTWGKHPSCFWWHLAGWLRGHAHHPAAAAASGAGRKNSLCRSDMEEPMGLSCRSMQHRLLIHVLVLISSISGLVKLMYSQIRKLKKTWYALTLSYYLPVGFVLESVWVLLNSCPVFKEMGSTTMMIFHSFLFITKFSS